MSVDAPAAVSDELASLFADNSQPSTTDRSAVAPTPAAQSLAPAQKTTDRVDSAPSVAQDSSGSSTVKGGTPALMEVDSPQLSEPVVACEPNRPPRLMTQLAASLDALATHESAEDSGSDIEDPDDKIAVPQEVRSKHVVTIAGKENKQAGATQTLGSIARQTAKPPPAPRTVALRASPVNYPKVPKKKEKAEFVSPLLKTKVARQLARSNPSLGS